MENPNSHRYEVENRSKIVRAFLEIETYSSFLEIQKASSDNSLFPRMCFWLSHIVQFFSDEKRNTNSIFLLNLLKAQILTVVFQLCLFHFNLTKENFQIPFDSFSFPNLKLPLKSFHFVSEHYNAFFFSSHASKTLSYWNISAKYCNLAIQNLERSSQNLDCFISSKNTKRLCRKWFRTFPLDSDLASVCKKSRLC